MAVAQRGWTILGIALVLFVALEIGYRALKAVVPRISGHSEFSPEKRSDHPYAGKEWFERFRSPQEMGRREYRYDPYRGWWLTAKKSSYVNISPQGIRLTLPAHSHPGSARRVFMLGGSTMWGITARDAYTIPSLTAARLKARGINDVEVVNFAHAGFNSTQEAVSVLLEIARGNVPAVAVFLDGYNDIFLGLTHDEPGHAWDEKRTQQLLDLGSGSVRGLLTAATSRLQIVQALRQAIAPERNTGNESNRSARACDSIATYYRNMTRAIQILGAEYDFATVFFQQPHHASSRKPPTAWEKQFHPWPEVRQCAEAIDRAMSADAGRSYFPLYSLFDKHTETVFLDDTAHITEAANAIIADRIVEVLAPLLERNARVGGRRQSVPLGFHQRNDR